MTKILIVEDEPALVNVLKMRLESNGFSTEFAAEGEKALGLIKQNKPHLILMDMNLPGMDGYELLKNLASNAEFKSIPVIIQSSRSEEEDKKNQDKKALIDSGQVKFFLQKPFDAKDLITKIQFALGE